MNLKEIKLNTKKTDTDKYTKFHRWLATYFTWGIINSYPRVTANQVTLTMFFISFLGIISLVYSAVTESVLYIYISFIIFNLSITFDCVDGNVARIKKTKSIKGLFYDRIIHNIIYPTFIICVGYIVYMKYQSVEIFLLFVITGILKQLDPITKSALETHYLSPQINNANKENKVVQNSSIIKDILSFFPFWNKYYVTLIIDYYFFSESLLFTITLTIGLLLKYIYNSWKLFRSDLLTIRV